MADPVSERLQQHADRIMRLWEERARNEITASRHHNSLILQNSLPQYLNFLITELSPTIERTPPQINADEVTRDHMGRHHGRTRAGYADYSMTQLILEYHILRQVVFQVLEEEAPLTPRERDIIISSIEQAVNDAATQFSETLSEIQELFMVTLTHDLKNPLNVMRMGTHLVRHRFERGDSHFDITTKMISALDRLDVMIQNLLDASRLRAGQSLNLTFENCNLEQLVQEVVEDLNFAYEDRFVMVSDGTVETRCSRKELRRVIENIATNAVKYGAPDTPITLTLQHTATAISITIHNEGQPIPPEAQSVLFQQFCRTLTAGKQKGWGLGLFLAKKLIEAHQGTIEVESAEGKGTSFIITLPVVPTETANPQSNQIENG
jgi:signal transduction histidine kinase